MTGIERCLIAQQEKEINEKAKKNGFVYLPDVLEVLFPERYQNDPAQYAIDSQFGWILEES